MSASQFSDSGFSSHASSDDESKVYGRLLDKRGALKRLAGDYALLDEFIAIFFEDSPILMQKIHEGIQGSDAASVERSAHALKGLVSNFGAQPCVDLILKMEKSARAEDLTDASRDFLRLKKLYNQLCTELSNT